MCALDSLHVDFFIHPGILLEIHINPLVILFFLLSGHTPISSEDKSWLHILFPISPNTKL